MMTWDAYRTDETLKYRKERGDTVTLWASRSPNSQSRRLTYIPDMSMCLIANAPPDPYLAIFVPSLSPCRHVPLMLKRWPNTVHK